MSETLTTNGMTVVYKFEKNNFTYNIKVFTGEGWCESYSHKIL